MATAAAAAVLVVAVDINHPMEARACQAGATIAATIPNCTASSTTTTLIYATRSSITADVSPDPLQSTAHSFATTLTSIA